MKIVNFYGAPSAGKSTAMLGLTYRLKMMGVSVENTPEFFKELILERVHEGDFGGQLLVLAEQNRRLARLVNKNKFAVTDCPLLLISFYTEKDYIKGFDDFAFNLYNNYNNAYNYFIERNHSFENEKRVHSETESDVISRELKKYLIDKGVEFTVMQSGMNLVDLVIEDMKSRGAFS